jgi:hypothetical protein
MTMPMLVSSIPAHQEAVEICGRDMALAIRVDTRSRINGVDASSPPHPLSPRNLVAGNYRRSSIDADDDDKDVDTGTLSWSQILSPKPHGPPGWPTGR